MMSKRERIASIGMGITCVAAVGMVVKHIYSPDYITAAVVNAMAVSASGFIGFLAYDSFKEGLTGRRQ